MTSLFRRYRAPSWRRRARLALGVARLRRREFDAAEKALAGAENAGGPAAPFASLKRSETLIGSARWREGEEVLARAQRASADPVLADDLAIAQGRMLAGLGSPVRARQSLTTHLASPRCRDRDRVLEAAARIAEEEGEPQLAAELYRRLYLEEPRSPRAGLALARLSSLVHQKRRFRPPDLPAVARRARALITSGDGSGALATWDLVLASIPSSVSEPRWRFEIAEAAIEARQLARAMRLLGSPRVQRGESHRGWLLGRVLFALGRDNDAIACLRAAAQGTGEHADAALYLLATSLDQTDRDREALRHFLSYVRRGRDEERRCAATWRAGWLSYRLGERQDARRLFQWLLGSKRAAAYHPSALYWLGRAHEADHLASQAADHYERLIREHTREYYGLLASERLAGLGVRTLATSHTSGPPVSLTGAKPPPPAPGGAVSLDALGHPSRAFCEEAGGSEANALVRAGCEVELSGLLQDAERYYEAAAAVVPARHVLLRLSEIAMRRKDRGAALARLKAAVPDYLAVPIDSLPRRYWELLFPRTDFASLSRYARARALDPALVCGLVLQESAFNPLAVSGAGALGLMQVLPETGREAARALGERNFTSARLFEPATNLRLGTWHFAALVARFNQNVELALAAYNAGEGRVRRWKKVFGTSEPTYFIEEVPYIETRLYVKRVLSHAAMYRAIYGVR